MTKWATKEAFFAVKRPTEQIEVPGLGQVRICGLTAGEKDDYEYAVISYQAVEKKVRMQNARAVLMSLTVYNQHGARLFGDEDIGRLSQLPVAIVDPILDVSRKLSGMAIGEIGQLVKNSLMDPGPDSDDSGSASPTQKDGQSPKSASE